MKRRIFLIMLFLVAKSLLAQTYQQTNIELDSEISENTSCLYEASTSIKLLDGFRCDPAAGKFVMLYINRYGVFPPDEGVLGGPPASGQDGVVGALPGELNVGDFGAAIYSIPICVPQGIGNMTPSIAVTYNNQSGNGLLGWGWDLSGLSSITRMGQTLYHDDNQSVVNFANDRFAVDGKRLMLCSGNYGGNGSVYKTEIDEMSRIVSYSEGYTGPSRFVIQKKDGTTWEYGGTEDSRIEPQNRNDVVLKWLVNKISDLDGNYMIFNYMENQANGESYIASIDYTLNEAAGITSMYKVRFDYADRDDVESEYVFGNLVQNTKILKNIVIINMMSGSVLYDYSFSYTEPGNYESECFLYYRLNSIGLVANGLKINATKISWNGKNQHYPNKFESFSLNKNVFNKVPFTGDFNGDGYSDVIMVPYKISNSYSANVAASVFLNKGDGVFDDNPFYTFNFEETLEWLYVIDFDGDGLDDVVAYYLNDDHESDWKTKIHVYLNRGNCFESVGGRFFDKYTIIYPGDFCAERKVSLLVERYYDENYKYSPFFIYWDGNAVACLNLGKDAETDFPNRVVVGDVNADGRAEIFYMLEDRCVVSNINFNGDTYLFNSSYTDYNFDNEDFIFPGDFNGDGFIDFLKYDNRTYWKVAFSDGNRLKTPVPCSNNNLLRTVTLVPQDRYSCSLLDLSKPSVTIRTADFDGDGKTDVAVFKQDGGNYYANIGFKFAESSNNNCNFGDIRRFYLGINHSHQYVHVGNFLGRENASVLGSVRANPGTYEIPKIVALYPQSSKYSVEKITDGLGNCHVFEYAYVMPSQKNSFYNFDYKWVNQELRTVAVPIRALCSDKIFSTNDNPCVTRYSYKNALYHKNGHGLLGFERSEITSYINNTVVDRKVFERDAETMESNFLILLQSYKKYNHNNQIVASEQYLYEKYQCTQNEKVIMPLLTTRKSVDYDFDTPNAVLKVTVENTDYQSDASKGNYNDVVNVSSIIVGIDASYEGNDASSCAYRVETDYDFDNNISGWIVARPKNIRYSTYYGDNDAVGNCEIFDYSGNNPCQITKKTSLPNAEMNYADPLKIVATYSYDVVGHTVMQTLTSPSSKNQRTLQLEFGEQYNYRYPTSSINENGWEISNSYDSDYGILMSTLDYNNFEMECSSDPFEINVEKMLPDGTKNVKVKRWAAGNKHAPQNASYYCWEKTTGNAETMTFFSKNGRQLRSVTFGLNGEAVYVDVAYDDKGKMISKSKPYIDGDEVNRVYYVYDDNGRLSEEIMPNGLVKTYKYNKLQQTVTTTSPDGSSRSVIESFNPQGWRMKTVDIGGNTINYDYYSDGKIKSAMIGDNAMTKIQYEYDNRRNASKMKDPAYGTVSYEYNAYGELVSVTTPRHCTTNYSYDMMGNLLSREESEQNGQNTVVTNWIYDNSKGKIGMLSQIVYGGTHSISYDYDNLLRIRNIEETVLGKKYQTSYIYDDANREAVVTYPSGLSIKKLYSNTGYYQMMMKADDETVLWRTQNADAMGNVTDYQVGNELATKRTYDEKSNLLTGIVTKMENSVYQNLSYSYDSFGNLINRTKLTGTKKSESFLYDEYNRLVTIKMNSSVTGEMNYDDYGNIYSKNSEGNDVFYDARYDNECPYAVSRVKTDLTDLSIMNQIVNYTVFDKILKVENGNNSLSIDYGYNYERIHSVENVDGIKKEKVYIGNCEYVNDNGKEMIYTYLKGPMGVFAVCCTDIDGNNSILYVHKDNLNSWCLITDSKGNIVQKTSYDAWGNLRNDNTWSGQYTGNLLCDRGFTGHEHLTAFGLINMNGRVYDPILSMMLSPDNYIQNPDFSQNFNRYSYCFNNPLSYSDPSGEWVEWLLYGVFNGVMNLVSNMSEIDDFGEGLLAFAAGMIQGCLSGGFGGSSWGLQVASTVVGGTVTAGVNNFVKQNDGSYNWDNIDKNELKKEMMYGLGSSLASSMLSSYIVQPTETTEGVSYSTKLLGGDVGAKALENKAGQLVGNLFAGNNLFAGMGIDINDIDFAGGVLPSVIKGLKEFSARLNEIENVGDMGSLYKILLRFNDLLPDVSEQQPFDFSYSMFRSLFFKI